MNIVDSSSNIETKPASCSPIKLESPSALTEATTWNLNDHNVDEEPNKRLKVEHDSSTRFKVIPTPEISSDDDDYGPLPPPDFVYSKPSICDPGLTTVTEPTFKPSIASCYEQFRKRKHEGKTRPIYGKSPILTKKEDAVYVFGKGKMLPEVNRLPTKYEEGMMAASMAIPKGELDFDVLQENPFKIPFTHEVIMKGHSKSISALTLERSGARLLSGGYDYSVKFWDFNTMSQSLQSFRSIEPCENYLIHSLEWNSSNDRILLGSASPRAKILDREGRQLIEFPKGYQYNIDMANTTGHVSNITKAIWHSIDKECIVTGALDSTVRIWSVEDTSKHKHIIKIKNERGLNQARVHSLAMDNFGRFIVVGSDDGSIQLFSPKGPYNRPTIRIPHAHECGTETSCLCFYPNNENWFLSRGGDDTLKMWDIRQPKKFLKSIGNLPNRFPDTDIAFSPEANLIVTGTSTTQEGAPGMMVFFEANDLTRYKEVTASSESVLALVWHVETNQILVGCGDGMIKCFFSPEYSKNGVLTSLSKGVKRYEGEIGAGVDVITPHALPLFQDALTEKQRRKIASRDPKLSHRPMARQEGAGSHGRLGTSLKAEFMKKILHASGHDPHEDPRDALLRHATEGDASANNQLDYDALERINQTEIERAKEIEALKRERERK